MIKQYIGRHTVGYVGSYDGEGTMWGHWGIACWYGRRLITVRRGRAERACRYGGDSGACASRVSVTRGMPGCLVRTRPSVQPRNPTCFQPTTPKRLGTRKGATVSADEARLIRCADHSLAPWAITCVHIFDGTADDVVAVPQPEGSEVEFDWVCPKCHEKLIGQDLAGTADLDDLRAVCIHCLRLLLKRYRKPEDPDGTD